MSAESIIAAVKGIIDDLSLFEQVEDIDALPYIITPAQSPTCLLQLMREPERPITHGRSQINADLDIHMWRATDSPTPAEAAAFKDLANSVVNELRDHPRLDGAADIAGESEVLIASRQMTLTFTRPLVRPSKTWQHAVITDRIQEWVRSPLT